MSGMTTATTATAATVTSAPPESRAPSATRAVALARQAQLQAELARAAAAKLFVRFVAEGIQVLEPHRRELAWPGDEILVADIAYTVVGPPARVAVEAVEEADGGRAMVVDLPVEARQTGAKCLPGRPSPVAFTRQPPGPSARSHRAAYLREKTGQP